jgi:predicted amidophosphoribosyltransferase
VLERAPSWLDIESAGLRCVGVAPYAGPAGAAIVAFKERGVRDLAAPMSAALARAVDVAAAGPEPVALVPVPSRPDAVRSRAADVLADLTRRTAAHLRDGGRDVRAVPALRHARNVVDQAGLDGPARHANIAGAFALRRAARPLLAGRQVVVVDDVITSGASLGEAVRALSVTGPTDREITTAVLAWAGGIAPLR